MTTARGRRKRLRKQAAPQRRRAEAAARAAIGVKGAEPGAAPPPAQISRAGDALHDLARELSGGARGDAKVEAAARGVADLADAYAAMARAARTDDPQDGYALMARARAAIERSDRERGRAGDAWPL